MDYHDLAVDTAETPQNASKPTLDVMSQSAEDASAFLKTLAHPGRLMILCHLNDGEKSVGELERLLDMRQAAVSQMLARLREEGLVTSRRDGKTVHYTLADGNAKAVIGLLFELFCGPATQGSP